MSLLSEERKRSIIDQLLQNGKVKVNALSTELDVSEETIRRDLDGLEKEGQLKRVYGGAVLPSFMHGEPPYAQRQSIQAEEKKNIGKTAAELIEDGDTLVIDVGTTTLELAKAIQGKKQLTILSNSLPVITTLSESLHAGRFHGKIILLGGEINPEQQSISGSTCENMMRQFRVNKAFISVGGLSLNRGISDYDVNEANISRVFVESAKDVIVLADHTKLGVDAFSQIASLKEMDVIVSNLSCPAEWTERIQKQSICWIKAE